MAEWGGSGDEESPDYEEMLRRARAGDRKAIRTLVRDMERMTRARVRLWLRKYDSYNIGIQNEDDLVNQLLEKLCADQFSALSGWDPKRGSLETFIGLRVRSFLLDLVRKEQNRRRLLPPGPPEKAEEPGQESEMPDEVASARELAEKVIECLNEHFKTEEGREMVKALFVFLWPHDVIKKRFGKTDQQVYRWRHRILSQAKICYRRLLDSGEA